MQYKMGLYIPCDIQCWTCIFCRNNDEYAITYKLLWHIHIYHIYIVTFIKQKTNMIMSVKNMNTSPSLVLTRFLLSICMSFYLALSIFIYIYTWSSYWVVIFFFWILMRIWYLHIHVYMWSSYWVVWFFGSWHLLFQTIKTDNQFHNCDFGIVFIKNKLNLSFFMFVSWFF